MKKLLIILTSILSISVSAQPSIGSANMPQNGDTLRYSESIPDSAVLASFNNTGANQNWQFGNLIPNRQGLAEYIASNQTPYSVSNRTGELIAPTLNLGAISVSDVYDFYNNSSTEFALDVRGFSFPNPIPIFPPIRQAVNFVDKDEVYQFPLNYLDRDSSNFNFGYRFNAVGLDTLGSAGYRINEVEAWGNITTPYGTFSCIKVKTDIVSYDTLSFGATSFGILTHTREYKWLSPQLRYPVANLSGNVVAGIFIPGIIQYRDSVRTSIRNPLAPFAIFAANNTLINLGDTVQFNNISVSLLPATYQWSISPATHTYVNNTNATSDNPEVQFSAAGFYDVQLIATNSNGSDTLLRSSYIEVRLPTGINEQQNASALKVYPNPLRRNEELIIEAESEIGQVWLYDQNSRLVSSWQGRNLKRIQLDLEMQRVGLYYLQIELDGERITRKVILH